MLSFLRKIAVIVAIAVLWEVVGRASHPLYFPPLSTVLVTLAEMFAKGRLMEHVLTSLARLGIGLGSAAVVAFSLGALMRAHEGVRDALKPTFATLSGLPFIVLVPIAVMLFGIGEGSKYAIVFVCALFPMLSQVVQDLAGTAPVRLVTTAQWNQPVRAMAAGALLAETRVLPQLPVVAPLRAGFTYGLSALMVAEMFGGRGGLGYVIMEGSMTFRTTVMYAGALLVVIFALAGLGLLRAFETRHR